MPRRKRKEPAYDFLSISVDEFDVSVDAGFNLDLLGTLTRYPNEDASIYRFETHLELIALSDNGAATKLHRLLPAEATKQEQLAALHHAVRQYLL